MDDKLIDVESLFTLFKKKFWIIIVITMITTGVSYLKASKMQPSYSAMLSVFMGVEEEGLDYSIMQEMNFYGKNIQTLKDMVMTEEFLADVLKKNNIDKDPGQVMGSISVQSSEDSPIVTMRYYGGVTSGNAKTLDVVAEEFIKRLQEIIPNLSPRIVNNAYESMSVPNKVRVVQVGVVFGIIASIGLILVIDYLDDTLKNKQDLEKLLPIPVLGDIPKHEKEFVKEDNYVHSKQNAKVNIGWIV